MIRVFLKEEWKKVVATLAVACFFLYFWTQGPFQYLSDSLLSLESIEMEFSSPKVVGEQPGIQDQFGTVGKAEVDGYGHSLILESNEAQKSIGLISTKQSSAQLSDRLDALKRHASELSNGEIEMGEAGEIPYLLVQHEDDQLIYLESEGVVETVRGYAGPINVGVFVSPTGAIQSVHHVNSKETESYLQKIDRKGYYQQYAGLALLKSHELDAVSGATLTSEAVARTTSELISQAFPEPLETFSGLSLLDSVRIEAKLSYVWILHVLVLFLIFFYGYQKRWRKSKKGVLIVSIISVIYIGFFLNNSFTYVSFIHPFVGTSVSSFVGIYSLFTLLGAIWGKNTYCKYVCPFGNVQRLMLVISPKVSKPFFLSNRWIGRVRNGLTIVLITGVLLGIRNWANYELFPDLFGLGVTSLWFAMAVLILLINLRYPLIWCRLLCPTGSVLDFVTAVTKKK